MREGRKRFLDWVCSHADFARRFSLTARKKKTFSGRRVFTIKRRVSSHGVFLEQKRHNGEEEDVVEQTFTEDNSFCCAEKKEGRKIISLSRSVFFSGSSCKRNANRS